MAKRKKQSQTNEPHSAPVTGEPPANGQAVSALGADGTSRTGTIPFTAEQLVVPLRAEHLQAEKHWVEAGTLLVRKTVESRTETVPVETAYEEVQIERVPVGRVLTEGESAVPRQEGPTWIIPMIEEEIVVLKRRIIREELRITKQHLTRQQTVQDVVRREDIQVTADGGIELVPDNSLAAPQAG